MIKHYNVLIEVDTLLADGYDQEEEVKEQMEPLQNMGVKVISITPVNQPNNDQ